MDRGVKIAFLNKRINAIHAEMNAAQKQVYDTYRTFKIAEQESCDFIATCGTEIDWDEVKRLDDLREKAYIEYDAACKYAKAIKRNLNMHNAVFERQLSKMLWIWK